MVMIKRCSTRLHIKDVRIKQVWKYNNLGSVITDDEKWIADSQNDMGIAIFILEINLLNDRNIYWETRKNNVRLVRNIFLLSGRESWTILLQMKKRSRDKSMDGFLEYHKQST